MDGYERDLPALPEGAGENRDGGGTPQGRGRGGAEPGQKLLLSDRDPLPDCLDPAEVRLRGRQERPLEKEAPAEGKAGGHHIPAVGTEGDGVETVAGGRRPVRKESDHVDRILFTFRGEDGKSEAFDGLFQGERGTEPAPQGVEGRAQVGAASPGILVWPEKACEIAPATRAALDGQVKKEGPGLVDDGDGLLTTSMADPGKAQETKAYRRFNQADPLFSARKGSLRGPSPGL